MAVTMLIGNYRGISLSLFGKGNSIPSVIANEFTEATYDLYLSSLVELGLVLLLVSVGFSILGRLLIWQMGHAGWQASVFGRAVAFLGRKTAGPRSGSAAPSPDGLGPAVLGPAASALPAPA